MRAKGLIWGVKMIVVLAVLFGGLACQTTSPTDGAGATEKTVETDCQRFCQHLQKLGCEEGKPLADGTSCQSFCVGSTIAGNDLNIDCVTKVKSCGELSRCQ